MRHALLILLAVALSGCSLALSSFSYGDGDSGVEDGGVDADVSAPDGGPDGGPSDGGNDAGSDAGPECTDEVCDGADNDCDGAVDEGLINVLGSPVVIDSDPLGFGLNAFVDTVALEDGFAVTWHVGTEDVIRVAVFDGTGTLENEETITSGTGTLRQARLAVMRTGSIEQVAVAYVRGNEIWLQLYSSSGARLGPATMLTTFTDGGVGPDHLELAAFGDSVVLGVTGDQIDMDLPLTLVRYTPSSGDMQVAQVFSDDLGQLATASGTLLAATDPELQGDPAINRHDPLTLERLGTDTWSFSDRCDSSATLCEALLTVHPASVSTPAHPIVQETVAQMVGGELVSSHCLFVGQLEDGFTSLTVGECLPRPSDPLGVAARAGAASVVVGLGALGAAPYAYLEIPTTGGEGAEPFELADYAPLVGTSGHILAARGANAYLIGQLAGGGTGSIRAWRFGCE